MTRHYGTVLLWTVSLLLAWPAYCGQWPRCAVRSGTQGAPAIVVNGQPFAPLFFCGNNQFGRDDVLLEELRRAAEAKIPFFAFGLPLAWHIAEEETASILNTFCAAHPEGYFLLRVWVGPNHAWVNEHPEECITKADGTRLGMPSPSSLLWREAAGKMLADRVRFVIEGPHGGRFLGVIVHYLQTGEWFYPDTNAYMDYSAPNLRAFRQWLKKRYRSKKRLQKAWGSADADFDTAAFPDPEQRDAAAWGVFRDPVRHRPAMDMQRFQSELMAETIAYFARIVKTTTRGRSLAGAFYGYTMELNNNGPRALAHSGHLALGTLLECPHIDLILAPYSYFERQLGQPGHFHLPVDSVALHGKLAIMEEDSFTHLAQPPGETVIAPGWRDRTKSTAETLALWRRNYGNFLTHRCGFWLFDLLSDGRWNFPEVWENSGLLRRIAAELRSEPPFQPEVAFAVSEENVHYLRATTHPQLLHALSWWRSELDRIGAPVGYYLQRDLPKLPDSVKVLILPNAYAVSRQEERAVDALLVRGGAVIWTYAPDIAGPKGIDLARLSRRTGFPVEARFDDAPIRIVSESSGEVCCIDAKPWAPRFIIAEAQAGTHEVLARYAPEGGADKGVGEVCAAARPARNGIVVYTAVPRLPVPLLRTICERSGIHLYRDTPGMTGVVGRYLLVHTSAADAPVVEQRFHWPIEAREIRRLVPGKRPSPYSRPIAEIRDALPGRITAIYRFTP